MILLLIVFGSGVISILILVLIERVRSSQVKTREENLNSNIAIGADVGNAINKICRNEPIDYNQYCMSTKEKLFYTIVSAVVIFFLGYVFYRSYIFSAVLTPLGLLYPRFKKKNLIEKRKIELNLQFKEGLYALSSSLSAGKSIEMAFRESIKDLSILYPDPNTYIIKEFQYIVRRLDMNDTVEKALLDFAQRSHLDDVFSFTDVFITAKRTGGNMIATINNTSNVIGDKVRIKQEINTLMAQKKLEQKILTFIPILMILFLSWSAPDYMEIVFQTFLGRTLMTISVVMLTISYFISKKIMNIEV